MRDAVDHQFHLHAANVWRRREDGQHRLCRGPLLFQSSGGMIRPYLLQLEFKNILGAIEHFLQRRSAFLDEQIARLKAMLRKAGERTVSGLWDLIGKLVDIFEPGECANYFRSCGYDPE